MNKIGFLAGLRMGMRIAAQRVVSTASEAVSMYLYGTPSDSGNIGLRSGETVTYYDGAVLPPLPEWDKTVYPYAVITTLIKAGTPINYAYLRVFSKYEHTTSSADNPCIRITDGLCWSMTIGEETWGDSRTQGGELISYNPLWTNFDLYKEDGTLGHPASDPIPVSGVVGYSYNGTVLPELPEWDKETYPAALITPYMITRYQLLVCESYVYQHDSDGNYEVGMINFMRSVYRDGAWSEFSVQTPDSYGMDAWWLTNVGSDYIIWTNTNVLNEDGTVCLAASDPIPVYE